MALRAVLAFVAFAQALLGDHEDLVLRSEGVTSGAGLRRDMEETALLCIRAGDGTLEVADK